MNLAMMGIVGAVAGASSTGLITLLKSALDNAAQRRTSEAERRHHVRVLCRHPRADLVIYRRAIRW